MKITKVAAKKSIVLIVIALVISISIPHVSLWGFGIGTDVGSAATDIIDNHLCNNANKNKYACSIGAGLYKCDGSSWEQIDGSFYDETKSDFPISIEKCKKNCQDLHGSSCLTPPSSSEETPATKPPSDFHNNCKDCIDYGYRWCARPSDPKDDEGLCIKSNERCESGQPYTKFYSKCPGASVTTPATGTQTPVDHTKTTCENCFLKGQKFCKTIQTNVNFGYNYNPGRCIPLTQKCNDFREKEITNVYDCPPASTCGSICLNQMFYSGASYLYGSSQQLSMPMGQCSEGVPLYMLGNIIGQQSATSYQQMPQLVGGQYTSADVGCNPNQQCYCIRINMQNFQQSSAATNYPSATIPGRTQTPNWKNPKEKKNPPRTTINNYNGVATSGKITARIEQELFQAGDKITIKGSVDKVCETCDGWKYTCEAFKEIPCNIKDKLLGFQLKYEFPKCPADIPDTLDEKGEETFTRWKKVLDAALAIYMIKEGGNLFGGSGSGSSIMNNPYMLQILVQQSGANINPYMLSMIMQGMQTTGKAVENPNEVLPVTGMVSYVNGNWLSVRADYMSSMGTMGIVQNGQTLTREQSNSITITSTVNKDKVPRYHDIVDHVLSIQVTSDKNPKPIEFYLQDLALWHQDVHGKTDMSKFVYTHKKTISLSEIEKQVGDYDKLTIKYKAMSMVDWDMSLLSIVDLTNWGAGTKIDILPWKDSAYEFYIKKSSSGSSETPAGRAGETGRAGSTTEEIPITPVPPGRDVSQPSGTFDDTLYSGSSACDAACKSQTQYKGGTCEVSCYDKYGNDYYVLYKNGLCTTGKNCCCSNKITSETKEETAPGITVMTPGTCASKGGKCIGLADTCDGTLQVDGECPGRICCLKDAASAKESKGMNFQQVMMIYFVLRMLAKDPPADHVCYRVCGEQYTTQAGKAPVCSRMISQVAGVSEVVIGYQNATYTCQEGNCGKWANKQIKIEIYSPTGNFIKAYTTKTDGKGGFSYTFAAPHVDGEFTAIVSIPGVKKT